MELGALVDVDDAVLRRLAVPHGVVEEALDAVEDHLEDGEAAAEALAGQQVALARDLRLLRVSVRAADVSTFICTTVIDFIIKSS